MDNDCHSKDICVDTESGLENLRIIRPYYGGPYYGRLDRDVIKLDVVEEYGGHLGSHKKLKKNIMDTYHG